MARVRNQASRLNQANLLKRARGVTAIGRHSQKGKVSKTQLTELGRSRAKWAGQNLPQGFVVSARRGELPRQGWTARYMVDTYPGQKLKRIPMATALGTARWMPDLKAIEAKLMELGRIEVQKQYADGKIEWDIYNPKNKAKAEALAAEVGDAKFLSDWVNGKLNPRLIAPPETVGTEILKGSIQNTQALMNTSIQKPFGLNVTSSWYESAILKVLGIDYRTVEPKRKTKAKHPQALSAPGKGSYFKETEAMLFFHLPDGKMILSWRGKKFDVTKPLAKILK